MSTSSFLLCQKLNCHISLALYWPLYSDPLICLSIFFHHHIILITTPLWCVLMSGRAHLLPLFFLKIVSAALAHLLFQVIFGIALLSSVKSIRILIGIKFRGIFRHLTSLQYWVLPYWNISIISFSYSLCPSVKFYIFLYPDFIHLSLGFFLLVNLYFWELLWLGFFFIYHIF